MSTGNSHPDEVRLISSDSDAVIRDAKRISVQVFTEDGRDPLGLALVNNDDSKHSLWVERTFDQALSEHGAFRIGDSDAGAVKGVMCLKWAGVELVEHEGQSGPPLTADEMKPLRPFFDLTDEVELKLLLHSGLSTTNSIFIRYLAIQPEHQRKGLGTKAMQWLQRLADAQGVGVTLYIQTADNIPFYEKLGFKVHGPERISWGEWSMNYWAATYATPSS